MWMGRNMLDEARGPQEKNNMEGSVCTALPRSSAGPLLMATVDWRCRPQRTGPSALLAPGCRVRGSTWKSSSALAQWPWFLGACFTECRR